MNLVIDIGNTNITFGVFNDTLGNYILKNSFRLITPEKTTTDELAFNISNMLQQNGIKKKHISQSIFSSVVPSLNHNITKLMRIYFNQDIYLVEHKFFCDFNINYQARNDLGLDRLVNIKAAEKLVGFPIIVVDFGTATTIDVINKDKNYLGGMIIPGVAISLNTLVENTSMLPKIEMESPKKLLGKSTKENMQNGLFYLNSLGINSILQKIKKEMTFDCLTVITGGLGKFISRPWNIKFKLIENLTLKGLKIILDEKQKQIKK